MFFDALANSVEAIFSIASTYCKPGTIRLPGKTLAEVKKENEKIESEIRKNISPCCKVLYELLVNYTVLLKYAAAVSL